MTDIQFAKEHLGEYFQYRNYKVRVIGYDSTGFGKSVIIDYPPRMADRGHRFCGRYSRGVVRDREMLLCKLGRINGEV